ncbi:MAG: hypothetical protein VX519_03695 [Myxococcota bacterium]|nr:hypothetical protein [Myxococcota bacterium]
MGTRKSGFDPLSSLFESSGSSFMDDTTSGSFRLQLNPETLSMDESNPEDVPSETQSSDDLDKAQLARELAKAAMARAQEQQTEPEAPPAEKGHLAARATRPVSALDAARQAAESERQNREAAQAKRANQLPRRVEKMLSRKLSGVKKLEVINALAMDDRQVLKALWKAHRTRMAEHGVLGMVVAATSVLRALDAVPPGQLVAAIARTEKSEYLVWLDIGSEATIAAFPDAKTWITRSG